MGDNNMRILLVIFSISNTLENISKDEFKKILDEIETEAEIDNDQIIMLSFCDETENKEIYMYFLRNIIDELNKRNIILGHQFLGDVYYKDILNSDALLYEETYNKEKEIFNYVSKLEENENFINLFYINGNMDENKVNEYFSNFNENVVCNLINKSDEDIINELKKRNKEKKYINN